MLEATHKLTNNTLGFSRRGADYFDTSLPPTDWDSTVPEKTINPYIRADENDIKTWPSF